MNVLQADLEAVVLTVLDEFKLGPQGHIAPETLYESWPSIGLRDADLDAALEGLRNEQALELVEHANGERSLMLTEAGHARMLKLNTGFTFGMASYQRLRRQAENRLQARQAAAAPGARRRTTDAVGPQIAGMPA